MLVSVSGVCQAATDLDEISLVDSETCEYDIIDYILILYVNRPIKLID